jgi:hypothetical protein
LGISKYPKRERSIHALKKNLMKPPYPMLSFADDIK